MPNITTNEIKQIYILAKKVYLGELKKNTAVEQAESFGMSGGSASDLITNFKHMIHGDKYTRTSNNETTEYFLIMIKNDFGYSKLENAVKALNEHIQYYENLRNVKMHGLRKILQKYKGELLNFVNDIVYPDEIDNSDKIYTEGSCKQVLINKYERDPDARKRCIERHGFVCTICQFNFEEVYGDVGKNFIHVHHIKPLSDIKQEYQLDPENDLVPVCPNCHAMIHKRKPPFSPEEIKAQLKKS